MMMMMIGDPPRINPTVQIPFRDYQYVEDPTIHIHSPVTQNISDYENAFKALHRYLPSNQDDDVLQPEDSDDFDIPVDAYSCDDFRMYEFKVKKCARARSHDWTECPFTHPGEKARRRDPRKYHYSGGACPDFRKGVCRRGDGCEFAHGVFECWLHPDRYRTQSCKDGTHCRRRVCFFAHTPGQLRLLPNGNSPQGSPGRFFHESHPIFGSSPKSMIYSPPSSSPTDSPPVSPTGTLELGQVTESMHCLQLNKMKIGLNSSPPSWRVGFWSTRSPSSVRRGFMSLPSTPIPIISRSGLNKFNVWDAYCEEESAMERVESGRLLRERIYAKLSKENSLDRVESASVFPDLGWVSELVN